MLRLFIALPLPQQVETALDQLLADLRPRSREVKWVPAKNIHLTVKFLGDTDQKLVEEIKGGIDEVTAMFQPFETNIDRVGAFPNLRRPRTIWVGNSEPLDEATQMAEQVDRRMHQLGFAKEARSFSPHLTLGRVRQGRRVDDLAAYLEGLTFEPIRLKLDRLVLFQSTLTPQGAIYEHRHESILGQERFGG